MLGPVSTKTSHFICICFDPSKTCSPLTFLFQICWNFINLLLWIYKPWWFYLSTNYVFEVFYKDTSYCLGLAIKHGCHRQFLFLIFSKTTGWNDLLHNTCTNDLSELLYKYSSFDLVPVKNMESMSILISETTNFFEPKQCTNIYRLRWASRLSYEWITDFVFSYWELISCWKVIQ